ncbi:unnamed protein product [Symbiodinium necroappetens]|uniref:Uncharacterized protein n=1 Tax=Symbiodinium necroappetens TaxID=1628268 RepID=A0A812N9W5_9DINO|nr:unnamed protein product [Symbiodinium necroappetens]
MAYPVQKVCAWSKAHDVDSIDAEECPDVRLVCAKPFGAFPNACSGTAHLAKPWFVSFYSFSKETAPGTFETSLQTRVLVDRDTTCAGTYQKMPAAFPTVGEEEVEISTTARPFLGPEDKNIFVWVMGAVVVLFVAVSAVILRWNRLSPQRSSQELGREIELQSTRPF